MDSSFTVRPRPGAPSTYAPRDPVPVREATPTDLNGARAVTASSDGQQGRQDRPGHERQEKNQEKSADSHPEHHETVVVDPENRAAIFRERDVRSAERAHPDDALMRRRAYGPAPSPAPGAAASEPHADIKA
jgi:hypothetical protein